tara:strand:- start:56 stop:1123 length:1068 start_codon:yes stop_codon:yes gene_type:complete
LKEIIANLKSSEMYVSITAQTLGGNYSSSSADFVAYLEKENQDLNPENREFFFNQYNDEITPEEVVREIDANTAKLEKKEPRFYSITLNPSARELKRIQDSRNDLKKYTREVMKDYVASFNREINGRPVNIDDIKYYAKIEHQRSFKGTDKQVRENQLYASKILKCKVELQKIKRGEIEGNISKLENKIKQLEKEAPHHQNGQRIVQGMPKEGHQSHVHIIVSRKDASNKFSLSPGSKYKASQVQLNGKMVKRGFVRDSFFQRAEKTFDTCFGYHRNFVETYTARKEFIQNPKTYFSLLLKLPTNEKMLAMKILKQSGMPIMPSIPTSQAQIALKVFNRLRRGVDIAVKSSSIGI